MTLATQNGHVKGGWQGGRGWRPTSADVRDASKPGFLDGGGGWAIDGVYEALDSPNEYYFDEQERKLYYWPNGTDAGDDDHANLGGASWDDWDDDDAWSQSGPENPPSPDAIYAERIASCSLTYPAPFR